MEIVFHSPCSYSQAASLRQTNLSELWFFFVVVVVGVFFFFNRIGTTELPLEFM